MAGKSTTVAHPQSTAAQSLAVLVAAAAWGYYSSLPPLSVSPDAPKQLVTFDAFYPFYLTEHSDQTCKQLHFVGTSIALLVVIANPVLLFTAAAASGVGMVLFHHLINFPNGAVEGVAMLATFILLTRLATKSWRLSVGLPVIAYAFAWVGHFFFEHNKPATFIYPTFSLASDLRMWYQLATGQLALL